MRHSLSILLMISTCLGGFAQKQGRLEYGVVKSVEIPRCDITFSPVVDVLENTLYPILSKNNYDASSDLIWIQFGYYNSTSLPSVSISVIFGNNDMDYKGSVDTVISLSESRSKSMYITGVNAHQIFVSAYADCRFISPRLNECIKIEYARSFALNDDEFIITYFILGNMLIPAQVRYLGYGRPLPPNFNLFDGVGEGI